MTASGPYPVAHTITATGQAISPFVEGLGSVDLEDIARSLSHLPYALGHTPRFVSLAQFGILRAKAGPPSDGRYALLWGCPACYVGPATLMTPEVYYRTPAGDVIGDDMLYAIVRQQVFDHFGLPEPSDPLAVRMEEATYRAIQTVARDVGPRMLEGTVGVYPYRDPLPEKVEPLPPEAAFKAYLEAWREYRKASPKRADAHLLN